MRDQVYVGMLVSSDELSHHGILGMKWGVRRYQNDDGTLTSAGKQRYSKMSDAKLHKTLKKQIKDGRAKRTGQWYARWAWSEGGEFEKKLREQDKKNIEAFEKTPEYKAWERKFNKLNNRIEKGKYDPETIDDEYDKLWNARPKPNYTLDYAKTYTSKGVIYTNDFINKAGKDIGIARLRDIGYSQEVAEEFVKRLAKSGRTLGDI